MSANSSIATSEIDFPETADIESSSDAYATRFAGATGTWMLEIQARLCLDLIKPHGDNLEILDVGGGHGQLAIPLTREGHRLTVLGSAPVCEHRIRSITESGAAKFVVGNVVALPFPDQSFDVALSFRLVTHCTQWEKLIAELCRVARKTVIVDYPTGQSINAIAPALFEAKKKVEVNTRTWRLFRHDEIRNTFAAHGFQPAGLRKQFFLPMVVHRMLKSRPVSAASERVCRALGLTTLAGSPVIAAFYRP